ncbi:PREDICTED: uncharacterized protein LOC104715278 [Camelina sativa]|uniref:Uncharacterized protein LOC104715278 n=1 Tax=Camelina sativa TaxID=90675 RepID=A0ABM0TT89_CAMSA|nr:PREDICTED: uncharacterized protein LOC104715278 [Camelina sativa]
MQRMWATIMFTLIVVLSISIQTKGNERNDTVGAPSSAVLAPQSEDGLLPNPLSCLSDVKTIPDCVKAVKHFKLITVTKNCCVILLNVPEDCFGYIFPIPLIYRILLKIACKLLGHIP